MIHIARFLYSRQGGHPINPNLPLGIAALALLAGNAWLWWG